MDPAKDDFRELSGLLFGAKERYLTVRATITHTVDGSVAEESHQRFVDWRFAQPGGSGLGILRTEEERRAHGPDVPQDFYLYYEDTEEVIRLWHETPDRWREEMHSPEGSLLRCVVVDGGGGEGGPRWIYHPPDTAAYIHFEPAEAHPSMDYTFMLDPSEEVFHYALADDATVQKTGRTTTVAGRNAVEVLVGTVSWGSTRRPSSEASTPLMARRTTSY